MHKPDRDDVKVEYRDSVALVLLNRGVTNALDLEFVNALSCALKKLEQDETARGIVLASSSEKFFSIGFDIPSLFGLPRNDFKIFFSSFDRLCLDLYTFPKPAIAAITGHAVAGGCIIALCCDYRFIAEGKKKMGLNEIKLGVPIPYPADLILQRIAGSRHARGIVDTGEFHLPEALKELGIVDAVLPASEVLTSAIAKARLLGEAPPGTYAMIKKNRVELTGSQIRSKLDEKEEEFLDLWYSDEARKRLKDAMAKF